jgi:serine/threonine-protein kinase
MIGRSVSHYQIVEKLGEGGMGIVYKAHDTRLDRDVAIKFLPPQLKSDKLAEVRFVQEAKAASALNHSNIAVIHEIDETCEGRMFIVMAYYDGQTLKEKLENGPLPVAEALRITSQLASALVAAHEKGILHRDIKPANVLMTQSGEVKLADFGLAKLVGQTRLTKTGTTVGTIAYMSPEQANSGEVDHRSDIFSLGVLFYELLTGVTPFKGDHEVALLYNIMNSEPAPLATLRADLPEGTQGVVERMLAKDVCDRYASAGDLLEDLTAIASGLIPAGRGRTRSHRWIRAAAFAVPGVVLGVVAWIALPHYGSSPAPQPAPGAMGDDRFTIVVAPFWGTTAGAMEDAEVTRALIHRELSNVFHEDDEITVVNGPQLPPPRLPEEALDFGRKAGATIVVWGEVFVLHEEVEIRPHITTVVQIKEPWGEVFVLSEEVEIRPQIKMVLRIWEPGGAGTQYFVGPVEGLAAALQTYTSQPGQVGQREEMARDVRNKVLLVAGLYYSLGARQDKAESLLRRISPPSADALATLGNVVRNRGRLAEAESLITAALELNPRSPLTYNILGLLMFSRRDCEKALAAFEKAISLDPSYDPSYGNAGVACFGLGRLDDALSWFNKSLAMDVSGASWTHNQKGIVYRRQGDFERAEQEFQRAIDLDTLYADPYYQWGMMRMLQTRVGDAIPLFERALEIDPSKARPRHAIGYCYQLLDRYDQAVVQYEAVLSQHPEVMQSYVNLGHMHYERGHFDKAADVYARAVLVDPSKNKQLADLVPYFQIMLRICGHRSGESAKAEADFAEFVSSWKREGWYGTLVGFFAGDISPDSLLAAAGRHHRPLSIEAPGDAERMRRCEAHYFLGAARLLGLPDTARPQRADSAAAVVHFQECLATGLTRANEYVYAAKELERLSAPAAPAVTRLER